MNPPTKTLSCILPMLMGGVLACGTIPQHWYGWTWHYAQQFGVDGNLLTALVWVESRYCTNVVNPDSQATGLGQLLPSTARSLGVNPSDPYQNLYGSAKYLRQLWDRYPWKSWPVVLAAYHAGPGNVAAHGGTIPPFSKTQAYVENVLSTYRFLQEHNYRPGVKQ